MQLLTLDKLLHVKLGHCGEMQRAPGSSPRHIHLHTRGHTLSAMIM